MPKSPVRVGGAEPPSTPSVAASGPLSFVDARGGAFASIAAAIARANGRGDAIASTSSKSIAVPSEVAVVLGEIGLLPPEILPVAQLPKDARRVDVGAWGIDLHTGEGDLERLALARIARDRIERRVEALA